MTENGKEDGKTEPEEREQVSHEECWMSSVQGEETRHEMTDISENEDGAKVAPIMEADSSHPQATLSPEYEEQVEYEQKLEHEEKPQPEDQQAQEQQERICDDEEEKPRDEHENHQDENKGETAAGEDV